MIIGTRGSKLARVQAEQVAAMLGQQFPERTITLQIISTTGDRVLDVALSQVGDKGLFVKELEVALYEGTIDLAVHSGKDLPSVLPDELTLAAFPARVDPRDALVLPAGKVPRADAANPLDTLGTGAVVGTSSLRRAAQLRALRPDLRLRDVRGNVDTRLRKLDSGEYDALILATAGLQRLSLHERISAPLPTSVLLPAVAQGALALEARAADTATLEALAVLDDPPTRGAVLAERACLRHLEGGCQVPIAVYAEVDMQQGTIWLRGLVSSLDGSAEVRAERRGDLDAPEALGLQLGKDLIAGGAATLLDRSLGDG